MATLAGVIDVVTYIVIVIALSGHRLHAVMAVPELLTRLASLLMPIGTSLLITQLVAG